MMSLRSLMGYHALIAYFSLAYCITWLFLLPLGLSARGATALHLPAWWHALGALGPLTAAFVVTRASGRAAIDDWLRGFRQWRVGVSWWLLAVASPFALFVVSATLVRAFGGAWPDFARLGEPAYANSAWLLDVLFVGMFAYAIGEEPGWRGFALPRLQGRHGPLKATLLLTPLWAIWHWPAFLYRPSYQGGAPVIVGFVFGLLAGAIVLTFLYNGTRGSLPVVILWHALVNIVLQVASIVSQPVVAIMNVLLAAAAIAIITAWIASSSAKRLLTAKRFRRLNGQATASRPERGDQTDRHHERRNQRQQ